jgi:hypothetical protein
VRRFREQAEGAPTAEERSDVRELARRSGWRSHRTSTGVLRMLEVVEVRGVRFEIAEGELPRR